MGPRRRRRRHRSASPTTRSRNWATSFTSISPRWGHRIEQGKSLGSVESVKAVSDIYSPVSGEVVEVNETLAQAPEKLNQDPHGAAWLVKVRMSAPDEVKKLLSAADYQTYVGAES